MWETVELRELRVFLTLAEELHFGRSAGRLGLTQSRVSQSLRELERKLGGQLFHRTSRRVALTPLGERFQAALEPAYDGLLRVLESTYSANGSLEGTLRLGLLYPTAGGPHMTEIVAAFERLHPGCEVRLTEEMLAAVIPERTPSGRAIRRRRLRHSPRTAYEFEALVARGTIVHPTVPSFA